MKIPRLLKTITALLVCIVFIRAINGAGPVKITNVLIKIQEFDFNFEEIIEIIEFFKDGKIADGFTGWDSSAEGIEGFIRNIGNILASFFSTMIEVIKVCVVGLWRIMVKILSTIGILLEIILSILGFTP